MCIFIRKIYDQITLMPNLICCFGFIQFNSSLFFVPYEIRNRKRQFQIDINCEIGYPNVGVSCEPFIFVLLAIYFPILMRRFYYCCFFFFGLYIFPMGQLMKILTTSLVHPKHIYLCIYRPSTVNRRPQIFLFLLQRLIE